LASTISARAVAITVAAGAQFSSRAAHDDHSRGPRRDGRPVQCRACPGRCTGSGRRGVNSEWRSP
jgi:hypothetical protein